MSLSTSPDELKSGGPKSGGLTSRSGRRLNRAVFGAGVAVTALLFLLGAWQRRWIADDGLIVLRTVRNLLAGNGPVFNAGERVEANTSTVWTYLVYAVGWLSEARLEYVVLTIALVLSTAAVVVAMLGTVATAPDAEARRAPDDVITKGFAAALKLEHRDPVLMLTSTTPPPRRSIATRSPAPPTPKCGLACCPSAAAGRRRCARPILPAAARPLASLRRARSRQPILRRVT